ncbi:MAG: dethiobiotin synthase [Gammaproteobacteria bacterium]|nr:dethiobiotin synthase [Gammaproteobacteria bacterium]
MPKIAKGFFITGTDTSVGKTFVAKTLLIALAKSGYKTIGLKPVASGGYNTKWGLRNHDACILKKYSTEKLSYEKINPYVFQEPIAPHIAAINSGIKLTIKKILFTSRPTLSTPADYIIIEGAGGWLTPLNKSETMADLAQAFNYPIVLVVGIRLGCINHALLTLKCIKDYGVKLHGWIANILDVNMPYVMENIHTIKNRAKIPLLAVIPYQR